MQRAAVVVEHIDDAGADAALVVRGAGLSSWSARVALGGLDRTALVVNPMLPVLRIMCRKLPPRAVSLQGSRRFSFI